jgi:hypothetical protein
VLIALLIHGEMHGPTVAPDRKLQISSVDEACDVAYWDETDLQVCPIAVLKDKVDLQVARPDFRVFDEAPDV